MVTCLCSPSTHVGAFRCRLHRNIPAHVTMANDNSRTSDAGRQCDRKPSLWTVVDLPSPIVASINQQKRHSKPSSSPMQSASILTSVSLSTSFCSSSSSSPGSRSNYFPHGLEKETVTPCAVSRPRYAGSPRSSHANLPTAESTGTHRPQSAAMAIMKRHMRISKNLMHTGEMSSRSPPRKVGLSRFGSIAITSNNQVPLQSSSCGRSGENFEALAAVRSAAVNTKQIFDM
ncbi:hypothetical protein KP509_1Z079900 [Ceratopteris richardii]|nr:hypothetical protein KP509_1Z079900 [Ceratopteris richardii]